jgi:hypothetical protein
MTDKMEEQGILEIESKKESHPWHRRDSEWKATQIETVFEEAENSLPASCGLKCNLWPYIDFKFKLNNIKYNKNCILFAVATFQMLSSHIYLTATNVGVYRCRTFLSLHKVLMGSTGLCSPYVLVACALL